MDQSKSNDLPVDTPDLPDILSEADNRDEPLDESPIQEIDSPKEKSIHREDTEQSPSGREEGKEKEKEEIEPISFIEAPTEELSVCLGSKVSEVEQTETTDQQEQQGETPVQSINSSQSSSGKNSPKDKNDRNSHRIVVPPAELAVAMQSIDTEDLEGSLEAELGKDLVSKSPIYLNKPNEGDRFTPVEESPYLSFSDDAGAESSKKVGNSERGSSIEGETVKASGNEKKEHLYKILVIGELGTGKTSIIKRYVHQFFSQHYRATIGVDFALKVISWDADTLIRLQLWDIAGQERFGNMTRVYYKEAVGAFVVFDVTRAPTFEAVVKWKNDLDSKVQLPDGTNIPCVLLANKCDQTKEGLVNNIDQMDDFCKDKGFLGWFETSAKENINIDEAARFLVGQILTNDKSMNTSAEEENKDRILLGNANQQEPTPKKSCCR